MKKFLAVALFAFGTFALISCGGSSGSTHCEPGDDSSCDWEACANEGGSAWYEHDGKKYECKGSGQSVDCTEAEMELYQDCGVL